jgi:hypothetical protein
LNPLHPSLKYAIHFFVIDILQNLLLALKKLVLVTHLNPFEFFFHCKKQAKVIGVKSGKEGKWLLGWVTWWVGDCGMQRMPYSLTQSVEARLV